MAVVLKTVRKYIPTFGENNKKPESEQIVAYLRNVNVQIRQDQLRKFMKADPTALLDRLMEKEQSTEIYQILVDNVVRFDNLKLDDGQIDPETKEPKLRDATIQDLIALGEWPLCIELFMNIINASQLSKEQAKNSESQSGSTAQVLQGQVVETVQ